MSGSGAIDPHAAGASLTSDQWQAHTTREAAKAIGQWLEERGGLHKPIASLSLRDLECLATAAIARWVVLNTNRPKTLMKDLPPLDWLYAG